MPTVTWNPSDKHAGITLSGSNKVATSSAGSGSTNQTVRSTVAIVAVKEYFEVTVTGTLGQYFQIGVMDGSFSVSGNVTPGDHGAGYSYHFSNPNSVIYRGGALGSYSGTFASGDVVRVAIDRAANKMWWAINNKTWSGSAVWMDGSASTTADPATGTGGLDISAVTGTLYPACSSAWTGDVATINGGTTAFSYAVPSGFTALDSAVPPPTYAQATQVAVEHWLAANPDGQVTQVALEQWASVASGSNLALVTQVALEQWVPIAVPITARQNAVTVISG